MMKEDSENTGNFITGMVAGIQNFIGGFGLMEKKVNNTFDDVDKSVKNAEKELQGFKGEADKLDNFNLSKILTDNTQDDNDREAEEESIDSKFKKPYNRSSVKRNSEKTNQLLQDQNVKLVKTEELTDEEISKQRFTKRFFKKIDDSGLNIDDLRIDTDLVDMDSDGVEEKIIIVRQREVVE